MDKYFINKDQAIKLKKLGFEEKCIGYFQKSSVIGNNKILPLIIINKAVNFNDYEYSKLGVPYYSAPLYSQAFEWFRDNYNLVSEIKQDILSPKKFSYRIVDIVNNSIPLHYYSNNSYEEAQTKCLDELIEIAEKISIGN